MKKTGALILSLLLAGCDAPNDTQLIIEAGKQLQRTIDKNPQRQKCEDIARGREWLTHKTIKRLTEQGCAGVIRSASETNFAGTSIFRHHMTMLCGRIAGRSFTGKMILRKYIYSVEEGALVMEPLTILDKTPFENHKTLEQLKENFQRQQAQYCQ